MQNSFFGAICRVGIFMICAQAIVHFRPQEMYEKYLRFLVSVMVMIQLFLPLGGFLLGGGGADAAEALEQFRRELEQSVKEAQESAAAADALLGQMTLEEVRKRVEEQAEAGKEETEGTERAEGTGTGSREEPGPNIEIEAVEPIAVELDGNGTKE